MRKIYIFRFCCKNQNSAQLPAPKRALSQAFATSLSPYPPCYNMKTLNSAETTPTPRSNKAGFETENSAIFPSPTETRITRMVRTTRKTETQPAPQSSHSAPSASSKDLSSTSWAPTLPRPPVPSKPETSRTKRCPPLPLSLGLRCRDRSPESCCWWWAL